MALLPGKGDRVKPYIPGLFIAKRGSLPKQALQTPPRMVAEGWLRGGNRRETEV